MITINKQIADAIFELKHRDSVGIYDTDFGAVIGDAQFIIVYDKGKIYLAHISEFDRDGVCVRFKEDLLFE